MTKLIGTAYFIYCCLQECSMSVFILGQRTSLGAIACCGAIVVDFFLGVDQEDVSKSFPLASIIYSVLASFFVSLFFIFTKKILPVADGNIWAITFYNSTHGYLWWVVVIINIFKPLCHLLRFEIGYVTWLQIKVTSPLTHNHHPQWFCRLSQCYDITLKIKWSKCCFSSHFNSFIHESCNFT